MSGGQSPPGSAWRAGPGLAEAPRGCAGLFVQLTPSKARLQAEPGALHVGAAGCLLLGEGNWAPENGLLVTKGENPALWLGEKTGGSFGLSPLFPGAVAARSLQIVFTSITVQHDTLTEL